MNCCHRIHNFAEEYQPVLYTPIFIGNECIIVASQDQMRHDHFTLLGLSRIMANGDLIPLEYFTNNPAIYNFILNQLYQQRIYGGQGAEFLTPTTSLNELKARLLQYAQHQLYTPTTQNFSNRQQEIEPMDTAPLYPFHLTKSTSTTELTSQKVDASLCHFCYCCCCNCTKMQFLTKSPKQQQHIYCNRGCNTDTNNEEEEEKHDFFENDKCMPPPTSKTKELNFYEQRKLRNRNLMDIV